VTLAQAAIDKNLAHRARTFSLRGLTAPENVGATFRQPVRQSLVPNPRQATRIGDLRGCLIRATKREREGELIITPHQEGGIRYP
jgi:hypothetical protein